MNKKRFYIISSTLLLIGLFAGIVQYVGMFDSLYAASNNPGHSWSQMECSTSFCVDTNNNRVGVGTITPQVNLDINGGLRIKENITCNISLEGLMSYSNGKISICNGSSWYPIANRFSCGQNIIDSRDENTYSTVLIGNQCWMKENLKYLPQVGPGTGYSILGGVTDVDIAKATDYYINYGVLYSFPTAKISCPNGWHLPTDAEWQILETYLGMPANELLATSNRGIYVGPKLSQFILNGNNSSNYSAKLGGYNQGSYSTPNVSQAGYFHSPTSYSAEYSVIRVLSQNSSEISRIMNWHPSYGVSVRCVKD